MDDNLLGVYGRKYVVEYKPVCLYCEQYIALIWFYCYLFLMRRIFIESTCASRGRIFITSTCHCDKSLLCRHAIATKFNCVDTPIPTTFIYVELPEGRLGLGPKKMRRDGFAATHL